MRWVYCCTVSFMGEVSVGLRTILDYAAVAVVRRSRAVPQVRARPLGANLGSRVDDGTGRPCPERGGRIWPHNYICVCDPGTIGAGFAKTEQVPESGEVNETPSERPLKYGLGCY